MSAIYYTKVSPEKIFQRMRKTNPKHGSVLRVYQIRDTDYYAWGDAKIPDELVEKLQLDLVLEKTFSPTLQLVK